MGLGKAESRIQKSGDRRKWKTGMVEGWNDEGEKPRTISSADSTDSQDCRKNRENRRQETVWEMEYYLLEDRNDVRILAVR